ncbi:hypothetical protein CSUB01_06501 [Colletotrichum sublineola]|uniref:Uncharacterized protein n=1 Tax=Colletotrichum sublineola TaxID=1173701 RepID=A0A066X8D9_COLSU|nr:hypothetical protein CSUB01_06501 [Colletotrichum sublineola]
MAPFPTGRGHASIADAAQRSALDAGVDGATVRHEEQPGFARHRDTSRGAPEDGLADLGVVDGLSARGQGVLDSRAVFLVWGFLATSDSITWEYEGRGARGAANLTGFEEAGAAVGLGWGAHHGGGRAGEGGDDGQNRRKTKHCFCKPFLMFN